MVKGRLAGRISETAQEWSERTARSRPGNPNVLTRSATKRKERVEKRRQERRERCAAHTPEARHLSHHMGTCGIRTHCNTVYDEPMPMSDKEGERIMVERTLRALHRSLAYVELLLMQPLHIEGAQVLAAHLENMRYSLTYGLSTLSDSVGLSSLAHELERGRNWPKFKRENRRSE